MKRLSRKGFTLVELLAVIVVLAVIMVIAGQAIAGVLAKNKVDAFKSSLDMAAKQAKMAYMQYEETLTPARVEEYLDFDKTQFRVSSVSKNGVSTKLNYVCIKAVDDGKFDSMDRSIFQDYVDATSTWTTKAAYNGWSYDSNELTTACKVFQD